MRVCEPAHAKVNLVLRVGAPRADGLHPLCSIFASLELADLVIVEEAGEDHVVCPGVEGQNLASDAVSAFRRAVPDLPPLSVTIEKRIPVAAGMGGGSADAAAVLRAANELSGARLGVADLRRLAAGLGSDVPSQVDPRHALVSGAGEEVAQLGLPRMALVLCPQEDGLSTARVFAELDRLRALEPVPDALSRDSEPLRGSATAPLGPQPRRGSATPPLDPEPLRRLAAAPLAELARGLENDLAPAAISLRPELGSALERLVGAGALGAQVTGSGPTTFGLFHDRAAAEAAASRFAGAIVTEARAC